MRSLFILIVTLAVCGFARPGQTLYGQYDRAEYADEDLVTAEPLQPPAPTEKPLS